MKGIRERCRLCVEWSPMDAHAEDGVCDNCGFKTFKSNDEIIEELGAIFA